MKKYLALVLAGLMLLFVSCGKSSSGGGSGNEKPTPSKTSVVGCWELVSVTTKVAVGSVNVNVYIDFKSAIHRRARLLRYKRRWCCRGRHGGYPP